MLIDPFKITNFKRTDEELQAFILFCVSVAGKKAVMIAQKLDNFLMLEEHSSPFYKIIKMEENGTLLSNLKLVKMGKYKVLHKAYLELASLGSNFLKKCTPSELENITGISFKTSRFFITHSRINSHTAVIDTHMLKFLSNYIPVPKNTSMSSKTYSTLEIGRAHV